MITARLLLDLIDGFVVVLRADPAWRGDLKDSERDILITAFADYLRKHFAGADFSTDDFVQEQKRIRLTLILFAHWRKRNINIVDDAER